MYYSYRKITLMFIPMFMPTHHTSNLSSQLVRKSPSDHGRAKDETRVLPLSRNGEIFI